MAGEWPVATIPVPGQRCFKQRVGGWSKKKEREMVRTSSFPIKILCESARSTRTLQSVHITIYGRFMCDLVVRKRTLFDRGKSGREEQTTHATLGTPTSSHASNKCSCIGYIEDAPSPPTPCIQSLSTPLSPGTLRE